MYIKPNFSLQCNFNPRKMVFSTHWIGGIQSWFGHGSKDEYPSLPGMKAQSTSPKKTTL
jgi:hypothetical protein